MNLASLLDLVHFQRPGWLWALLLLPLPWLAWRRHGARGWQGVVDPHLMRHLLVPGRARARLRVAGVTLALALVVLALSGPGWRQAAQPLWKAQEPLVIALDLSDAITTPDLPPSRLAQARAKIATLLQQRKGGEVGLVAWADDAYTVAPLTTDAGNIALFLEALSPQVMPVAGARPERGLTHAAGLLQQAGFDQGRILLITGEADEASRKVAAALAARGYRVAVLGLGTEAGAMYRDREGRAARSRLDEAALRALAAAGKGGYARLSVDDGDLRALGVLEPAAMDGATGEGGDRTWLDQGYWLLLPVLLLAALAFRRGAGVLASLPLALLAGMAMLAATPRAAHASGAEATVPADSLWRRPDQQAQRRLERGVEAYRQGDFTAAADAFGAAAARGADAQYNLANALARQGRYDEALAAYDRALAQAPGREDAIANRAVVEAARKRKPPPGQGQGQGQGQEQEQNPGAPRQPGEQGQQAGADPPRAGERPRDRQEAGQGSPPADGSASQDPPSRAGQQRPAGAGTDEDPEQARRRQAQADREQRERMGQALGERGADPATAKPSAAQDGRTPEQRQAHEAWLRRVPDDPGGLLWAKFRLEHERRQREGR